MEKNSIFRIIYILLIFLVGVFTGLFGLWIAIQTNTELRYFLFEQATANLPQAKIATIVQSIVQQDKAAALRLWEVYDDPSSAQQKALVRRREKIISDLIAADIQPDYMVLSTEWWTTCCEPGVTNDSRSAGGARVNVQFLDQKGLPMQYIFDVFTHEPYWGSAAGFPPRDWVIRDVYPIDQNPIFWLFVYDPQVRTIQPPDS